MKKALLVAIVAVGVAGSAGDAAARARFRIDFGFRPGVVVAPREMVMVPGTDTWFYPGPEADVFWDAGAYWAPWNGVWYRAPAWGGPWVVVESRFVPAHLVRLPHDYRHEWRDGRHQPYGAWERAHRHDGWDRGPGRGHGVPPRRR